MQHRFRWLTVLFLSLVFPAGVFAAASDVSEALGVTGNTAVTRGDFLRASVILLGLPVDFDAAPRAYRIYPELYQPYVRVADEVGALDAFGTKPDLAANVTRGEALRLLVELRRWQGSGATIPFRDVEEGTDLWNAVQLAANRAWAKPLRQNVFGVNAVLRAKEARSILTRAADDTGEKKIIKIKIVPKKNDPVGFQSKKFRDQVKTLLGDEYLYAEKLRNGTGSTAQDFVTSLHDPYTTLFDPAEAKEFRDQLGGTLTGIGTHLEYKEEALVIVSVVKGSPAERAGLKAGDEIVSVNKKTLKGMNFNDAVKRIRGPEGSPVRIGVVRDGDELSFDMVRAVIDIPDTEVETRSNVAIVTVSQFGDHLLRDAPELFEEIAASNPTGIILDLRNNPGGYLEGAPAIVGAFLPEGSVYVRTRGRAFNESYVTDRSPSIPQDVPLIVLVNEASASAAEITAGALQDAGRATILGKKTFGKGTVQTVYPFQNKSSLKFTIAEWLTPDSHPINDVGIEPDVEVEQSDAGDAQLEKALELIHSL